MAGLAPGEGTQVKGKEAGVTARRKNQKSPTQAARAPHRKVDQARAEQTFVVSAIKRKGLAQELNERRREVLADRGAEPEERAAYKKCAPFAPDDARLTDKVCKDYAKLIGDMIDIAEDGGDGEELRAQFLHDTIVRGGAAKGRRRR